MFRFEHERKAFLNKKRKDGLTVFTELNTGGELCKKVAFTMRRQFPIFTLFSVACLVYQKER